MAFGFYGKLPARGDFVRAGLPHDFVSAWDRWLQSVLPTALGALGEAWWPAPAWRFRLAPGVCGAEAVSGVLLPSMDSVGRVFPLTVAGCGLHADSPAEAESIARCAIEEAWAPDRLLARVGEISLEPGPSLAVSMSLWLRPGGYGRALLLRGLPDAATLISMLREDADAG